MLVATQSCSTQDAMSRWGDDKTLHFIQLYRQRECLWNTRLPLYKNKQARENAYQNILQTFNDKRLDIKSVKTKIKNLRSVYHTELKKVRDTSRYKGEREVYKPSLSWFNEMHEFLGDFMEDRCESTGESETISIDVEPTNTNIESTNDTVEKVEHITIEAPIEPHQEIIKDSQTTVKNSNKPISSHHQCKRTPNVRIVNRRKRPHESFYTTLHRLENTVLNLVNTTQQQPNVQIQQEDEFHIFALSVAAQLRQLPLHIAIATQSKIQSTLSEARLNSIFSDSLSQPSMSVKIEDPSDD